MSASLWPLLLVFHSVFGSGVKNAPNGYYFGLLRYPDQDFRLILHDSSLIVIGFRANVIPLKSFSFTNDSISFSRADFYSEFKGVYDPHQNSFSGVWIDEDRKKIPLEFRPVDPDTVVGYKPKMNMEYEYNPPAIDVDGIEVAHLTGEGMTEAPFRDLSLRIRDQEFGFLHSLLVSRNSKLVFEDYYYNFDGRAHFGVQSVTKSFVSALTGIAIQRREIHNVGDPLCQYLTKYRKIACNQQNRSITLEEVLTMSTGLQWNETEYDYGDDRNSLAIAGRGNSFKYLFSRVRGQEGRFAYNSMNHLLMNMVLKRSTGLANKMEMKKRLLEPLGIKDYDLGDTDQYGLLGDISLRPRDMLKFGMLFLNEGRYNGKQMVPADWVRESTRTRVSVGQNLGYAYFWWTARFIWKGLPVHTYFAWGYGGQYIFVTPELNLVVVMNGTNWSTDPVRFSFDIMQKYIIPACE